MEKHIEDTEALASSRVVALFEDEEKTKDALFFF